MRYPYLLFDADNTLFDFDRSNRAAFDAVCAAFDLPDDDEAFALYERCNNAMWAAFDRGECTKDFLVVQRFRNFFAALGVESVEQCLPAWNMEGAAYLRRKAPAIHLMLDESIHGPVDAARACRMDAADILNIKLMKCGGLYPAEQINAIAQANGLTCMVGCMMETKLSITAGLSFVAAKKNVMDADLDSFMEYVGGETHFPGGFTHKGSDFVLCDAPGFGLDIDF